MTNTSNGNGHDPDEKEKVVKFPTLAERDRIRKKQNAKEKAEESAHRKAYKAQKSASEEPFFNFGNIPPFAKFITIALIAVHVTMVLLLDDGARLQAINDWGFIPAGFTGAGGFNPLRLLTPITYNFIHSDWTHLGFNALMGIALCTFVEKMFSTKTTIRFFFLCGVGGVAIFFAINPTTTTPVIGASGSISGLFAATMMMLYEQGRMGKLTGKLANKGPWPIILIWAGIMALLGVISGGSIAWEAHVGGFLTGAILYRLMRTGKLRL